MTLENKLNMSLEELRQALEKLFSKAKEVLGEQTYNRRKQAIVLARIDSLFILRVVELIADAKLVNSEAFNELKDEFDALSKIVVNFEKLDADEKAHIKALILSALP